MFELFTTNGRGIVVWAQEESRLLNHDRIGTEHLLLALLHDGDIATAPALAAAGVSLVAVRQRLEPSRGRGRQEPGGHIPFTPRTKEVLKLSVRHGGETIGPPHLLRGMLDVPDSTGYQLLQDFECDVEELARFADNLARSGADPRGGEGVDVRAAYRSSRAVASVASAADPPVSRRMSAREIAASIGDLADELAQRLDRLAAGLRRYGRHLESCEPDSERGCSCGFDLLLADGDPPAAAADEPTNG